MISNQLLERYIPLADMLVKTFGPECEVVLHDLTVPEQSVVYVANGSVTGREVGQSFEQLIKQVILSKNFRDDYAANYFFIAKNGKLIRSSTFLLRDDKQKLIGALCINVDTSPIQQQINYLKGFLPQDDSPENDPIQNFPDDNVHISQMVETLIDNIIGSQDPETLSRSEKIQKIGFMEEKGIFLMKGSIEMVAQKLKISTVTVYSYLDVVRGKRS